MSQTTDNLELPLNNMDAMHRHKELPMFGRDTEKIFEEIDDIRKKQIELASEHVALEAMDDMSLTTNPQEKEDQYQRNLASFDRKEEALKSLMNKLDTLGQIMNDFREASDINPHTMNRRVSDVETMASSSTAATN